MRISSILSLAALVLATATVGTGCGKKPDPKNVTSVKGDGGKDVEVGKEAQKNYDAALEAFIAHDKANDWTDATCESMAQMFLAANEQNKKDVGGKQLAPAVYNAGLAYQRCNKDDLAKTRPAGCPRYWGRQGRRS